MRCKLTVAMLLAMTTAGCVTTPPLRPVVRLDDRLCATAPPLVTDRVTPLLFDKELTVELDQEFACLEGRDGKRRSFVVLALPERPDSYILGVTSTPRGTTLLSPRMQVLDATGVVLRERPRDAFMFHGTALYAGMRAYPGDRYLLITSDPDTVGQQVSRIVGSTQANVVPVGTGFIMVNTGSEANQGATFTHNGSLTVSARALAPVN